jgi:undecaprenyl-diphosphatase
VSIWEAILWGALQGATEFLPVSSSGHLVLVPWLLNKATPSVTYDVLVHAGTLLAALVYFWRDIWALLQGLVVSIRARQLNQQGRLALLIAASAVPAGLLGFVLEDMFTRVFGQPAVVAGLLLVTGGLLWLAESLGRRQRGIESLTLRDAVLIGLAQCMALLPGISRSGATISSGLLRGLEREAATRFSFLMVLPLIAGATGYELLRFSATPGGDAWPLLLAGFVAAAMTGYVALHLLLRLVRRHSLRPFAIYCWTAGLACLLLVAVR